MQMDAVR
jgi:hypothetical protein